MRFLWKDKTIAFVRQTEKTAIGPRRPKLQVKSSLLN
jgi:hypothetical protein